MGKFRLFYDTPKKAWLWRSNCPLEFNLPVTLGKEGGSQVIVSHQDWWPQLGVTRRERSQRGLRRAGVQVVLGDLKCFCSQARSSRASVRKTAVL